MGPKKPEAARGLSTDARSQSRGVNAASSAHTYIRQH